MVETCTRTVHGLPLLRPGPDADERIVGALGRAAEYYGIDVYAFAFASSHYHRGLSFLPPVDAVLVPRSPGTSPR